MNPHHKVVGAKIILILCCIGWPLSALTVFKTEPQGILALSWIAIILTMVDIAFTAEVSKKQEDEG